MNFPVDEYPLLEAIHWLINTAGLGGIIVGLAGGSMAAAFFLAILWIRQGSAVEEEEAYSYPTSALHPHDDEVPESTRPPFGFDSSRFSRKRE